MNPVIAGVLRVDKVDNICYNIVVSKKITDNKVIEIHTYIEPFHRIKRHFLPPYEGKGREFTTGKASKLKMSAYFPHL